MTQGWQANWLAFVASSRAFDLEPQVLDYHVTHGSCRLWKEHGCRLRLEFGNAIIVVVTALLLLLHECQGGVERLLEIFDQRRS